MIGIEVVRIVGDIDLGDEIMGGAPFDLKIETGRIADPTRLEQCDGGIDEELWRDRQRHLCATRAPRRIAP